MCLPMGKVEIQAYGQPTLIKYVPKWQIFHDAGQVDFVLGQVKVGNTKILM